MWGVKYGSWWMVQWSLDGTFSVGLHLDPRRRTRSDGLTYGPYLDVHVGSIVVSLGHQPARASGLVDLLGQGGIMRPDRCRP